MSGSLLLPLQRTYHVRPIWFAALACALSVACLALGERVNVQGGLGWDGVIYARWAGEFHQEIFVNGVDTYYIQRILPAAVVHYSLRAVGAALTDRNIILGFALLSVTLFSLMGWLWGQVARDLNLSMRGCWLGFVALFVNYMVLKHSFYVPVTTDVSAYAIGLAMLLCYMRHWQIRLALLTLAGAFTWPLAMYIGIILLMFPRFDPIGQSNRPGIMHIAVAATMAIIAFFSIRYVTMIGPRKEIWLGDPTYFQALRPLINLSCAISAIYLFLGCMPILKSAWMRTFREHLTVRRVMTMALIMVGFFGVKQWQTSWSNGVQFMGVRDMLVNTAWTTAAKPGVFLVTHAAYYGPFFILAIMLWRPICTFLHTQGVGLTLAIAAGFALSLNSQSRYFINIFVMVIPFVVKATESFDWRLPQLGLIAGLSLLASKCWLTTNVAPFTGRLLEFPDQLMFMTHGPWISNDMYIVQGTVALVSGFAIYNVCLRSSANRVARPIESLAE